ncbi:hypothetical protein GCM10011519_22090 [Marmoricola endophyticus]|uniref:Peptidase M15C domain-containing protein n=1 Tax=Marmoricola endophyticus TaxID=2040280 RepID=A0A917BKM5_9ACTN|nr:M15 family metallopeptidase [Marmoricola endophyticus]GGF47628.1 hypothetical protein GCM10011519_22090 [Marmoricola endophyticus]
MITGTGVRARTLTAALAAGALLLGAAGCGTRQDDVETSSQKGEPSATATPSSDVPTVDGLAMDMPPALSQPAVSADILVTGSSSLSKDAVEKVAKLRGVTDTDSFSLANFYDEERPVSYAAVDPATFRRFTPAGSAKTQAVWQRVAGGEMAVDPAVGKRLEDDKGYVRMGTAEDADRVHVGAYAPLVARASGKSVIDAVVNEKWASELGMKKDNALLVSTGATAPREVYSTIQKIMGKDASVQILGVDLKIGQQLTAVVTGGSVTGSLDTLRYTATAGGGVRVDPAWVAKYIRTEEVPILGRVTCNKVMLPELRAALTEVVQRGLADKIHPGEYAGCFVPKFIAGTSQLSFHSFGTALDMNVPGNQRGTVGEMDRTVVAIFKKWGFAWGGDWSYTDPMHFELHKVVEAR